MGTASVGEDNLTNIKAKILESEKLRNEQCATTNTKNYTMNL